MVSEERVTNGSLSTNPDIWTGGTGFHLCNATYGDSWPSASTLFPPSWETGYSPKQLKFSGGCRPGHGIVSYVYLSIDLTGVTSLTFKRSNTEYSDAHRFAIFVDNKSTIVYDTGLLSSGSNILVTIPLSGYTGVHTVYIHNYALDTISRVMIANISALATVLANFTVSNSNPMINTSVSFTNTSQGASSYLWDFGDGTTSTAQNPTKTYTSGGAKTVTLKINGQTTGDYVKTATVTVQDPMILARSGFEWL